VTGEMVQRSSIAVGLASSSVFPESIDRAFELAARLGYDGVEVMVTADAVTQDADALARLAERHGTRVLSVHAPCLLVTARVWGTDPAGKISQSLTMAEALGAQTVVAHPPFVWQRAAADEFPAAVAELSARTDVTIAIENMFPVKVVGALVNTYRPHWDPVPAGYASFTLDLSHTAAAGVDAVAMATRMGAGLAHVHLGDGSGAPRDEHLLPGRGVAKCAEVLAGLASGRFGRPPGRSLGSSLGRSVGPSSAAGGAVGVDTADDERSGAGADRKASAARAFGGSVIVEVSTRKRTAADRELDLTEALAFARWHLGQ